MDSLRRKLMEVDNKLLEKKQLLDELYEHEVVKQFLQTRDELNILNKKRQDLIKDFQGICSHPLWYMLYSEGEQVKIFYCMCLDCGKIEVGELSRFTNLIAREILPNRYFLSKYSYEEIKQAYYTELDKQTEATKDEIAKVLVKKYSKK